MTQPRKARKKCRTKFTWQDQSHAVLTYTTAMDCWSWSLPAITSCPGRRIDKSGSSICAACYASINSYQWPSTLNCLAARLAWTKRSLRSPAGRKKWMETMVVAIGHNTGLTGYFRGHDSGDFFSPAYVRLWFGVARQLPGVKFWFPTRSYNTPWAIELAHLNQLPNVTVRPSSHHFDGPPPRVDGLAAGHTAHTGPQVPADINCPKANPANHATSCKQATCRACWLAPRLNVSFHIHGRNGKHTLPIVSTREVERLRGATARKSGTA